MKFVMYYTYVPENRNATQERFKKTGGQPPEGVKMIGRWHRVGGGEGVTIAEADDAQALGRWAQEWSDLLTFEIYPAMEDKEAAELIP